MNPRTLEVEIDHGRVVSRGPEPLPDKARGLLTLLPDSDEDSPSHDAVSEFIVKWTGAFSEPSGGAAMTPTVEEARRTMRERFAAPDWEFSVGQPMSRDERNARG